MSGWILCAFVQDYIAGTTRWCRPIYDTFKQVYSFIPIQVRCHNSCIK